MRISLISLVILLGIIQGLYFSITIFWIKSGNRKANRIYASLMACLSLSLVSTFLFETNLYIYFPYLTILPVHIQLLIGPLFYYYIRTLTFEDTRFELKELLHGLPFALVFLYFLPFYLKGVDYKLQYIFRLLFDRLTVIEAYEYNLLLIAIQLSICAYLVLSQRQIAAYRHKMEQTFSTINRIKYAWLTFFTNTLISVYTIIAISLLLKLFGLPIDIFNGIAAGIASLTIYIVGYRGMLQSQIFYGSETADLIKNKKAALPHKEGNRHLEALFRIMETEKPFTDPELTLGMLAEKLSISRTLLSQIINDQIGMNFFDFINIYRIKEVKQYLLDPQKSHLKITALAEEAGFQSKTSFNRIFKLWLNMTPSEFREKYKDVPPAELPLDNLFAPKAENASVSKIQ